MSCTNSSESSCMGGCYSTSDATSDFSSTPDNIGEDGYNEWFQEYGPRYSGIYYDSRKAGLTPYRLQEDKQYYVTIKNDGTQKLLTTIPKGTEIRTQEQYFTAMDLNEDSNKDNPSSWEEDIQKDTTSAIYWGNINCGDVCENFCSLCSFNCGTDCEAGCSSACSGGCSGGCNGTCRGACENSCQGSCSGGCQGGCETSCASGCDGEEMLIPTLDNIVRAPNIQDIFNFIVKLAERFKVKIPSNWANIINNLTGYYTTVDNISELTPVEQEHLTLLLNSVPRIFEKIFNKFPEYTGVKINKIQSGSLKENENNEWIPDYQILDMNNQEIENEEEKEENTNQDIPIDESFLIPPTYPGSYLPQTPSDTLLDIISSIYKKDRNWAEQYWNENYRPGSPKVPFYPNRPVYLPSFPENEPTPEEPEQEEILPIEYRWYTHKPSAQEWLDEAIKLYNTVAKTYDAK